MAISLKVAVIGAGVAGLATARELQRESHQVIVFEKSDRLGGTWAYDPRVESDPLGLDPNRDDIVHGSLYESLRTNLPRQLMSFADFKFGDKQYGDPRMFPGHQEVLKFLEDFANHFELTELIRFYTTVIRVDAFDSGIKKFVVESKTGGVNVNVVEEFDAVVVCNGHNTQPHLASDIPGIETWSKKQMHSHNYRVPEPFRDQIVVVIGSGPSAIDLSREIAIVAKEVHMSSRSPHARLRLSKFANLNKVWLHAKIDSINKDGTITFEDGFCVEADIIFHCTGYKYHVPFLKTNGILKIQDKRIRPLYKHVFHPQFAGRLSFVGIPERGVIFLVIECQSRWIAKVLSRKVPLPSEEEMLSDVEEHYRKMEENGVPERHSHSSDYKIDYVEWVNAQVEMIVEKQIKDMHEYIFQCLSTDLYGYKDAFLQKYGT